MPKDFLKGARDRYDVITIGTPDHWHTAILIAAM